MIITYKNTITVKDVNAIRKSMGWRQLHPEQMQANIDAYSYIVAAYEAENAVAMFGLEWNGGSSANMITFINPEYYNKGIEKECVTRMFDFVQDKLKPGYGIQVNIGVKIGQESLYESFGFDLSTPENSPIPMRICLTNQVELTDKNFEQMAYQKR